MKRWDPLRVDDKTFSITFLVFHREHRVNERNQGNHKATFIDLSPTKFMPVTHFSRNIVKSHDRVVNFPSFPSVECRRRVFSNDHTIKTTYTIVRKYFDKYRVGKMAVQALTLLLHYRSYEQRTSFPVADISNWIRSKFELNALNMFDEYTRRRL